MGPKGEPARWRQKPHKGGCGREEGRATQTSEGVGVVVVRVAAEQADEAGAGEAGGSSKRRGARPSIRFRIAWDTDRWRLQDKRAQPWPRYELNSPKAL